MSMVLTTTAMADYRLVLPLYIDIIKILYMSMPLYACSMASLPVLVYWCGGVTAPHTDLEYVLQRFGLFLVNLCGRIYFWKRHRVYVDFFQNDSVLGEAAYSCGRPKDISHFMHGIINICTQRRSGAC